MDLLIAPNTVTQAQSDQPPATGTPGWATDGNPSTNTPATIFPAYAFNAIQGELIAAIEAAGLTPDRTKINQLAAAIQVMTQGASSITAADTGSANAYAVALSPVPLTLSEGLTVRFRAANANTGPSTLNVNGLGAVALTDASGKPLSSGQIVANAYYETIYSVSAGAFLLIGQTAGLTQKSSFGFGDVISFNANGTLAQNQSNVLVNLASGGFYTVNLPGTQGLPDGAQILIKNTSGAAQNVATQGADLIAVSSVTVPSLAIESGGWVHFVKTGAYWFASGSATLGFTGSFGSVMSSAGYFKVPGNPYPTIVNFGSGTSSGTSSGNASVTFPLAFPNSCLRALPVIDGSTAGNYTIQTTSRSNSGAVFSAQLNGAYANGLGFEYIAIGY